MSKNIIVIILTCMAVSCTLGVERNLAGIYVATNQNYNNDTLHIFTNGKYVQRICNKNKKNSLKNQGTWTYDGDHVILKHYYPDEDNKTDNFQQDVFMTVSMEVKQLPTSIRIYHRINNNDSYYEKK